MVLIEKGRVAEAVEHYRAALALAPELLEARLALGVQLMNLGRPGEATEHLEAAVRLKPGYLPSYCYLALALERQGKFEQALRQYARVLQLDPDSAPALSQSAFILATCPQRSLRDYDAALRMAQRACELTKFNDPEFLATLATVYAEAGRRPDAIVASRRAVEVARRNGREDFARRVERDFQQYWRQRPAPITEPK
jgi:tetratricopeptide (TPR) repeat protein